MDKDSIYDFVVKDSEMPDVPISSFKQKVLLVVNVASECGFTYQYKGRQELYKTYQRDGFEILGFPCNQFGAQESGTNEEIQFFCTNSYEVEFTLFDKIEVNGDNTAPIYEMLKKNHPAESGSNEIEWNFTKFLVGKNGEIVKRFGPKSEPSEIKNDIEALINE